MKNKIKIKIRNEIKYFLIIIIKICIYTYIQFFKTSRLLKFRSMQQKLRKTVLPQFCYFLNKSNRVSCVNFLFFPLSCANRIKSVCERA